MRIEEAEKAAAEAAAKAARAMPSAGAKTEKDIPSDPAAKAGRGSADAAKTDSAADKQDASKGTKKPEASENQNIFETGKKQK